MPEHALLRFLNHITQPTRLVLGVSGGLDSVALLIAAVNTQQQHQLPLSVIHVNHGISPHAHSWANHVVALCERLQVPVTVKSVRLSDGASLEAQAREARFAAFAEELRAGDCLLLAQHQADQAETLLFRLLRGAGVTGLGAIKPYQQQTTALGVEFAIGRPFLHLSKNVLEKYVQDNGLDWVTDESNADAAFDRNFLRLNVFPLLASRWPAVEQTFAQTSLRMQEADGLLNEYAALLMGQVRVNNAVSVSKLNTLTRAQRRLVLRYWLAEAKLPLLSDRQLQQLESDLLQSQPDRDPVFRYSGFDIRRYKDGLYALADIQPLPNKWTLAWIEGSTLTLPDQRTLSVLNDNAEFLASGCISVKGREGGEKIRVNGMNKSLKTVLQDADIPPWERERLPLIYRDNELVAVAGVVICDALMVRWPEIHFELRS